MKDAYIIRKKRSIAKRVRERIEKLIESDESVFKLFGDDLCGLCAVASFALKKEFEKHGFESKVLCGNYNGDGDHCWVEDEKYIWDLTITQFRVPEKVFRTSKKNPKYSKHKVMTSGRNFNSWPQEQRPTKQVIKKILGEID